MTLPSPSSEGTSASQILLGLIRATLMKMVKAVILEGQHSVAPSHTLLFQMSTMNMPEWPEDPGSHRLSLGGWERMLRNLYGVCRCDVQGMGAGAH